MNVESLHDVLLIKTANVLRYVMSLINGHKAWRGIAFQRVHDLD